VLIVTKARDNRLIALTRALALYLMKKPRLNGRGLVVYVMPPYPLTPVWVIDVFALVTLIINSEPPDDSTPLDSSATIQNFSFLYPAVARQAPLPFPAHLHLLALRMSQALRRDGYDIGPLTCAVTVRTFSILSSQCVF
jgi:hypothetical protein